MPDRFSLKDHLFNEVTVGQLAQEYAAALPHFDAERFREEALSGFRDRELLARLEWLADCIEAQLSNNFSEMCDEIYASLPPRLDPSKTDNDFGHFIHAVPGILAVRHGLEHHRREAMDLLYQATQRFSMEFYIRPFLNQWPEETLDILHRWVEDENYHVRRLVSEGTRPKLPWARPVALSPDQTLPLLDKLHADPTRYVARSVSNHLNDISKIAPERVLRQLGHWHQIKRQTCGELDWMTRHALRTLVKSGHIGALQLLGFRADAPVSTSVQIDTHNVEIGTALKFQCRVTSTEDVPILVDYRIVFARPDGRKAEKVFKLKKGRVSPKHPFVVDKVHRIKADATTFTWHPGQHRLILQVNGVDQGYAMFNVLQGASA